MRNPGRLLAAIALAIAIPPAVSTAQAPGGGSDGTPSLDCNGNGIDDHLELLDGTGKDCNLNGILDSCDLDPRARLLELAFPVGGGGPRGPVAIADLDRDGDLDLLASSVEGVRLHANQGNGRTYDDRLLPLPTPASPLLSADLDGDGNVDLAAGHAPIDRGNSRLEGGGVTIFAGRGAGRLEEVQELPVESPTAIAAGDLDGDGRVDLAVADLLRNDLALFTGSGGLRFPAPRRIPVGIGMSGLALADLDGDGRLDLAAGWHGMDHAYLQVLRNPGGSGSSSTPLVLPGLQVFTVRAGDLDADGRPDLATALHGTFGVGLAWNEGGSFPETVLLRTGEDLSDVDLVDLDRDGLLDLVVANIYAMKVSVHLNLGGRNFGRPGYHPVDGQTLALAHGDLDADGIPDVLVGHHDGLAILAGAFGRPRSRDDDQDGVPDECREAPFQRGDPDGDGEATIADPVGVFLFLFQGKEAPACLDAADSDGDGRVEITDPLHLLAYLFLGGPRPPAPGPPGSGCGRGTGSALGCGSYPPCGL